MPSETQPQHDAFYQAQTHGNKKGVGAGKNSLVHCASLSIDEEPMYCRATSIICTIGLFSFVIKIIIVSFVSLFVFLYVNFVPCLYCRATLIISTVGLLVIVFKCEILLNMKHVYPVN